MRRREVIAGLGATAVSPPLAQAQAPLPVIGYLSSASRDQDAGRLHGFRQGLGETGFVEGRNVAIEYRWADEQNERLPALAAELVGRRVTAIAASRSCRWAPWRPRPRPATHPDRLPHRQQSVTARARRQPRIETGGNLTGWPRSGVELERKRLELLHGVVPGATVVGALIRPDQSERRDAI